MPQIHPMISPLSISSELAWTANPLGIRLRTDNANAQFIVLEIEVETGIYTNTWQKLPRQFLSPDRNGEVVFYIDPALDACLQTQIPDFKDNVVYCPALCTRYRIAYAEFTTSLQAFTAYNAVFYAIKGGFTYQEFTYRIPRPLGRWLLTTKPLKRLLYDYQKEYIYLLPDQDYASFPLTFNLLYADGSSLSFADSVPNVRKYQPVCIPLSFDKYDYYNRSAGELKRIKVQFGGTVQTINTPAVMPLSFSEVPNSLTPAYASNLLIMRTDGGSFLTDFEALNLSMPLLMNWEFMVFGGDPRSSTNSFAIGGMLHSINQITASTIRLGLSSSLSPTALGYANQPQMARVRLQGGSAANDLFPTKFYGTAANSQTFPTDSLGQIEYIVQQGKCSINGKNSGEYHYQNRSGGFDSLVNIYQRTEQDEIERSDFLHFLPFDYRITDGQKKAYNIQAITKLKTKTQPLPKEEFMAASDFLRTKTAFERVNSEFLPIFVNSKKSDPRSPLEPAYSLDFEYEYAFFN